jgi:8-oxo-dGTP pyrophosphatase MutT (NUDIX family)
LSRPDTFQIHATGKLGASKLTEPQSRQRKLRKIPNLILDFELQGLAYSTTRSRELALAPLWSIPPYGGVWALPGGRIRKHEHPQDTARRVLKEIGIVADPKEFIGVFPVRFSRHPQRRYDITLC